MANGRSGRLEQVGLMREGRRFVPRPRARVSITVLATTEMGIRGTVAACLRPNSDTKYKRKLRARYTFCP